MFILKERADTDDDSGVHSLCFTDMMEFMGPSVLDFCSGVYEIDSLTVLSLCENHLWWRDDSTFNQLLALLSRLTNLVGFVLSDARLTTE